LLHEYYLPINSDKCDTREVCINDWLHNYSIQEYKQVSVLMTPHNYSISIVLKPFCHRHSSYWWYNKVHQSRLKTVPSLRYRWRVFYHPSWSSDIMASVGVRKGRQITSLLWSHVIIDNTLKYKLKRCLKNILSNVDRSSLENNRT